jgi:hypothetical protein
MLRPYRCGNRTLLSSRNREPPCYSVVDIHPPDDLCITSYCDNPSLLLREEEFHIRDIDSSRVCTKPGHNKPMTLSAPCTLDQPFRLASLHVRGHQNGTCGFDLLPGPQNSMLLNADHLANDILIDSLQLQRLLSYIRCRPTGSP